MTRRSFAPGKLRRDTRAHGPARYVLDWVRPDGIRERRALSTDKRVAQQLWTKLLAQRDRQLHQLDAPLRELADAYLEDLVTRATPGHVKNVRGILERALAALPERVSELRAIDLVRYRASLVAEGAGNRTSNNNVSRVLALLKWSARMGLITESPVGEIDPLPEREADKRCRRRALSEQEIQRFLAALDADDERAAALRGEKAVPRVPQAPLFRALIATGCRYGELRLLRWSDVDLFRRTITIRASNAKSGKERVLPVDEEVAATLTELRALHEELDEADGRVFLTPEGRPWCKPSNNVNRILRRVLEAAGISRLDEQGKKLDLHALRHTCATRLARARVGLVQAQHLLGHSDPKLTARIYTHVGIEDLRHAVDSVAGLSLPRGARERRA